ncbi:MAG: hypothetical protein AAF648_17225 [Pseudomonadota bacterium]
MAEVDHAAPPSTDVAALRNELAKWRERVPKLAQALKERTERVDQLEERLAAAAEASASSSGGDGARTQRIAELEEQQKRLKERCLTAEGRLHAQQLAVEEGAEEVRAWREKWQRLTVDLDRESGRATAAEQQGQALTADLAELKNQHAQLLEDKRMLLEEVEQGRTRHSELESQLDDQRQRNAQLFETTELAHKQMETLSADLDQQRAALRSAHEARDALTEQLAAAQQQAGEAAAQATTIQRTLETEVAGQKALLERQQQRIDDLDAQLHRSINLQTAQALDHASLVEINARSERALAEECEGRRLEVKALSATYDQERSLLLAEHEAQRRQDAAVAARDAAHKTAQLGSRYTELAGQHAVQVESLEAALTAVEAALARSESERAAEYERFTVQRAELEASAVAERTRALEAAQIQFSARAAAYAQYADALEAMLELAESAATTARDTILTQQGRYESQRAEVLELRSELGAQAEQHAVAATAYQHERAALIAARDELTTNLQELTIECARLQSDSEHLQQSLSATDQKLQAADDQNDQVAQALVCAQQQRSELEAALDDARVQLSERTQIDGRQSQRLEFLENCGAVSALTISALEVALAEVEADYQQVLASRESLPEPVQIGSGSNDLRTEPAANDSEFGSLADDDRSPVEGSAGSDTAEGATEDAAEDAAQQKEVRSVAEGGAVPTPEETAALLTGDAANKMLMILNQQLADARAENERLSAKLRDQAGAD